MFLWTDFQDYCIIERDNLHGWHLEHHTGLGIGLASGPLNDSDLVVNRAIDHFPTIWHECIEYHIRRSAHGMSEWCGTHQRVS